jgi:hemin uptake protein HemP
LRRLSGERVRATQGEVAPAAPARRWRSAELFGPAHEIEIEHGQAIYRLRLTSLGKLILTK